MRWFSRMRRVLISFLGYSGQLIGALVAANSACLWTNLTNLVPIRVGDWVFRITDVEYHSWRLA